MRTIRLGLVATTSARLANTFCTCELPSVPPARRVAGSGEEQPSPRGNAAVVGRHFAQLHLIVCFRCITNAPLSKIRARRRKSGRESNERTSSSSTRGRAEKNTRGKILPVFPCAKTNRFPEADAGLRCDSFFVRIFVWRMKACFRRSLDGKRTWNIFRSIPRQRLQNANDLTGNYLNIFKYCKHSDRENRRDRVGVGIVQSRL